MSESLKISWFGRCCFLVEYKGKKIIFDPYDTYYYNVDIGQIDADILISSSTWHDHGHIGVSPQAQIYTYPGEYQYNGVIISGIEAREDRGTPTVIFNVRLGSFSITNFADFGPETAKEFNQSLSEPNSKLLKSTTIAFIRPSIIGGEIKKNNTHNEIALNYCSPAIIFPEHYFPRSFIKDQVPETQKADFAKPNQIVDEMIKIFNYPVKEIDNYQVLINSADLGNKNLLKLLRLPPQVKYLKTTPGV